MELFEMQIHERREKLSLKSRVLEQATRAQGIDNAQMLRERSDQPLPERVAKVILHRTVGRLIAGPLLSSIGASEFLGAGGSQLVFLSRPDQLVKKLVIPSIGNTKMEAVENADHLSEITDEAAAYLEHYQTPTRYKPVKLPRIVGGYAVMATQPFVKATKKFAAIEELWKMPQTAELVVQQWDLLRRIRDLRVNSRMYPDLLGDGNVVLKEESFMADQIRIVDTIPVVPEMLDWPVDHKMPYTNDEYYKKIVGAWLEALDRQSELTT